MALHNFGYQMQLLIIEAISMVSPNLELERENDVGWAEFYADSSGKHRIILTEHLGMF